MGLSLALNTARSSILASSSQMAVVSRNTAGASDPTYSRKIATLVTGGGAARVVVKRAADTALFYKMLDTTSDTAKQQAVLSGINKLKETVGDASLNQSSAGRIGALNAALELYAKKPDDPILAQAVVTRASELVTTLNSATATIQKTRQEADAGIAESVSRVNGLLAQFKTVNDAIVKGTASGADVSDELDTRDHILAQLSEEMGISAVTRENNDMAIYTDSGVPLFEKIPRRVEFSPTNTYNASTVGSQVVIDGVPVTGPGPMPLNSGRLVGLIQTRDRDAVIYQKQLDEVAEALIAAFSEQSKVDPTLFKAGLFAQSGTSDMPLGWDVPASQAVSGLAGIITVNPAIDPSKGGTLDLLRDGGANGPDFIENPGVPTGSNAGFADRLYKLGENLNADRSFNPALGIGDMASVANFAVSSAGWLEGNRKTASTNVDYQMTLLSHASEALSNATGVNMDDETALMLQLEKSYSASAKLISVVDEMLQTLLNAVR
ncbi:flagellar hook-associated protein FlgK [Microvirga thermotolerans]|uniref:Flagellar hook-associated protein 1 n=1 Tax=Microvirga thermotolerans TaxID=2651334 RepID=A0A5P9JYY6_9HYPH|nr:flagellar hook-associated protein FlgK [Microvirga thermotolerans]QFU17653.1 flagellar hook-associated protein FlgK [Microvirga thermotolerans]